MTQLRRKMLEELQRRNYSEITTRNYLRVVADFAKHFGKSPASGTGLLDRNRIGAGGEGSGPHSGPPGRTEPSAIRCPGYLLFVRQGTLLRQSFDTKKLELSGGPTPVAEQVATSTQNEGAFSVSEKGVLVCRAERKT